MSRIGNKVVVIPEGATATQEGNNVTVKGSEGELIRTLSADTKMNIEGNEVTFIRSSDSKEMKAIHGTTRVSFNDMVVGVGEGFQKVLELIGVRYRAQPQGLKLVSNAGYSHPVEITLPAGVTVEVPANTQVIVKGANKEEVGESAANIRGTHPPEPYKSKGIRYAGEYTRRKEGKTGR